MPELQITSDDKEADIQVKMAKCKQHKALREEAAQLEAERLKRVCLEAEQHEREQLEAKHREQQQLETERCEQEWMEAEHWEQETQVQQKTGELKGKAWVTSTGVVNTQSKCKKRTCNRCTNMKVQCELPKGVELKSEEVGVKAGKKRALEDATSLRAGEKKVPWTRPGATGESEAGPLGVVTPTATPPNPLVAVVVKGFKLITAAMDHQTMEMQARRETQC
ncbi:hypothetical protein M404DRAFT_36529 [Pisolithus tinctorius Marx 270]|uniref:Uncharacterized protein n=1 Tax=Pisolithus tinctorius Marx 270 TaxID=870435 RepID=A0A0C3MVM5_PISTI|nr:hypothetical protein M404DRAFT_36529 [Pisolithus tinctorius Marx 270]